MVFYKIKKYKKSKKYKGVYSQEIIKTSAGQAFWGLHFRSQIQIKGTLYHSKFYKTEREAAVWYDKTLIDHGMEPIHIFKRQK